MLICDTDMNVDIKTEYPSLVAAIEERLRQVARKKDVAVYTRGDDYENRAGVGQDATATRYEDHGEVVARDCCPSSKVRRVVAVIGPVERANRALGVLTGGRCALSFDPDRDGVRGVWVIECGDIAVVWPSAGISTNIDWFTHQLAARVANAVVISPKVPVDIIPHMWIDARTPVHVCGQPSDEAWNAALAAARVGDDAPPRLTAEEVVALGEAQKDSDAVSFVTAEHADTDGPLRR